jgi:protocatechuate 3,4-dioxygenase beta subunit
VILSVSVLLFSVNFFVGPLPLYAEASAPDAPGSISGVIRNAAGDPLAGIDVYLYQTYYISNNWYSSRQTKSDEAGRYQFSVLPAGVYRIGAVDFQKTYASRFYPTAKTVFTAADLVVSGDQHNAVDLTLAAGGEIVGLITTTNGITLTGGMVNLFRPADFPLAWESGWAQWQSLDVQYVSDDQPQFHFTGLTAGPYRICASGNSANSAWQECYDNVYDIEAAQDLTVTAGAVLSDVVVVLGDGADYATVQGRLTSPQNEPLADVSVYVIQANTVFYQPYTALPLNVMAQPAATAPTYPTYMPYIYYTTTDANGDYDLRNMARGEYQLLFYDTQGRYRYEYFDDALTRGASTVLSVTKSAVITGIDAQLALGGHIKGTITVLGQPALSSLTLYKKTSASWEYLATTTSDPVTGNYDMGGLPAGTYRLEAVSFMSSPVNYYYYTAFYGGDYFDNATDIVIGEAATQSGVNINLSNGPQFNGVLSGRITADGKPLANARVSLYSYYYYCCDYSQLGPLQVYTLTDNDGRYTIEGLTSQTVQVRVDDLSGKRASLFYPGEARPPQTGYISVSDTATTADIDLDLPLGGTIKGRISQLSGDDVSVLTVFAVLIDTDLAPFIFREAVPAADGSYQLLGLAPGTYHVCTGLKYIDSYISLDCYGGAGNYQWYGSGIPLTVEGGKILNSVDILWGPDYERYLPVIAR